MNRIRRLVLDVLKPHQPNALDFASALADLDPGYRVKLTLVEMDEKTESIVLVVEGREIRFQEISQAIEQMGASVHSIDEVEVEGAPLEEQE